jgi:adenylyltransferase/sulfurtransferase
VTPAQRPPHRDDRLAQFAFWNAAAVRNARAIVVGAGALGNEVIKNLLLLGWGHILVVDHDEIEHSNLSRAVLFRDSDIGSPKVAAVERAAAAINPSSKVVPLHGDVRTVISAGMVARADLLFGCVDNVSARLAMTALAGRSERLFIDGGLTAWEGTVSVFRSSDGPCYGCGLTADDLRDVGLRRSCAAYAARASAADGVPTTPTVASLTAAVMVQCGLKWIHGLRKPAEFPAGKQIRIDTRHDRSWRIGLPRNAACAFHPEPAEPSYRIDGHGATWAAILMRCRELVGDPAASIHLPFTLAVSRRCTVCGHRDDEPRLHSGRPELCTACGGEPIPTLCTQIEGEAPWHDRTPASMACPAWSRVALCSGDHETEVEITGAPARLQAFFERS